MGKYQFNAQAIVDAVRGSYPGKYSEKDFTDFLERASTIKTKRDLIQTVENMFDIDTRDAKDMVA